jgi:hypothetical protein
VGTAPGWPQAQAWPDGRWLVRTVPGTSAVKPYRCPGCDQEIAAGVGHLVAWPADDEGSSADRRHWHTSCWQARLRRGPTRRG